MSGDISQLEKIIWISAIGIGVLSTIFFTKCMSTAYTAMHNKGYYGQEIRAALDRCNPNGNFGSPGHMLRYEFTQLPTFRVAYRRLFNRD